MGRVAHGELGSLVAIVHGLRHCAFKRKRTTVDVKTATDVASNIVTSAAVLVGGVWAYFKLIKGRTFTIAQSSMVKEEMDKPEGDKK
jgi:hypothetical protein